MSEAFCRGCLIQYNNTTELLQYTEKSRRLYVYSTGLQVKHNDTFTFQLCKGCFINMKLACKFKKQCRNSDKKHKQYLALKEAGEVTDLCSYLKNNDDSLVFRFPFWSGSNTPQKARDDDNESTCTSIRNFMADLLKPDDIPDTEAKIIKEVIEEEADILDDSLDSHWLQDDVSVDTDFKLDFSFSPFTTPRSVNEDTLNPLQKLSEFSLSPIEKTEPKLLSPPHTENIEPLKEENDDFIQDFVEKDKEIAVMCDEIDTNLEYALKNAKQEYDLDDILATPPTHNGGISASSTPSITKLLFGDKANEQGQQIEQYEHMTTDYESLEKMLDSQYVPQFYVQPNDFEEEQPVQKLEESEQELRIEKKNPDHFACEVCAKEFKMEKALKIHKSKVHNGVLLPKSTTKKDYMCDHCAKVCHSLAVLKRHIYVRHMKKKEERAVCKVCTRDFTTELSLKHHMLTHTVRTEKKYGVQREFPCSKCDAVFKSKSNLNVHERRHTKQYSIHCVECGRGFYKNSELKRHEVSHIGVRNYECNVCQIKFFRSDALTSHMKIHTGERPYVCDTCKSRFTTLAVLRKHVPGCTKKNKLNQRPDNKVKIVEMVKIVKTKTDMKYYCERLE